MLVELNEVLNSKIYTRENSKVTFQSPRAYLEPFLEVVKADNYLCKIQDAVINANEDGSQNIAYPRVVVEANLGADIDGYDSVIGIIFALNITSPVIKIYTGQNAHACTNLTIFNASALSQHSLMSDYSDIYLKAEKYFIQKEKEVAEFNVIKNKLLTEFYSADALQYELGRLLLETTKKGSKLGYGAIANASRLIQDRDSIYHTAKNEQISKLKLYDAITQSITDSSDILYRPNKTIAVSQLLAIH